MAAPLAPQDQLVLAAYRLSQLVHHTDWGEFIRALEAYAAQTSTDMVQAPLEVLPIAQGRAQTASRILDTFKECRTKAQHINLNRTK
jgi:hypothetical protein